MVTIAILSALVILLFRFDSTTVMNPIDSNAEWLEADGLGGFASGTVSGIRTRRYHALLLTATAPPAGRMVLVNGFDAWVETPRGTFAISSQRYGPDVVHPDGAPASSLSNMSRGRAGVIRSTMTSSSSRSCLFRKANRQSSCRGEHRDAGSADVTDPGYKTQASRPFLSGRDFHSTHHENGSFNFDAEQNGERVTFRSYDGVPAVIAYSNGRYTHEPTWYRNFLYSEEQARGLDAAEDLASPGVFEFSLSQKPAVLMLAAEGHAITDIESIEARYAQVRTIEQARRQYFSSPLERAADAYLVKRGKGKTLIAGYPWFGDWGRDTFIAMRGLCIATGHLEDARDILLAWAGVVSQGMLPNRFPDQGEQPEFNSVDASLWYIIAVNDYLLAAKKQPTLTDDCHTKKLRAAVEAILAGYNEGTRFGIRGRSGWIALSGRTRPAAHLDGRASRWSRDHAAHRQACGNSGALAERARRSARNFPRVGNRSSKKAALHFEEKFWNEHAGYLADVIDCDHQPGTVDLTFRPNQIFAVGGLPLTLLSKEKARRVVDAVEMLLLTPVGLRSLAPGEPGYAPHYQGGSRERDAVYHQGTVWPWLIGPFVEAWVRVRGSTCRSKNRSAHANFFRRSIEHLNEAGLGHISEICDAEPPHTPRGCPFQAWSSGRTASAENGLRCVAL